MKRKTVVLIGVLALMVSGCSGEVAVDSNAETSEKIESTEQILEAQKTEESETDNNQSEELTVEESSEIVSEEEIETETDAESGCLLPVSADSNGAFDIDLSEYPKLNKSIQEYQKQLEKHVANLERDTDKKVSVSSDLQRADTSVYSILRKSFTGYASNREYLEYAGYNYNVKTGKLLALKDIVNDQDALKEALIEQLEVVYPEIESDTDRDKIATVLCESENALWNIGYQGLTFYIEPKLTQNSESNYLPVMISFAEYQDLFEQKYVSAPDRYVVDIDAFSPFAYDMNCDGKAERIDIICEGSSSIESLTVQIGNLEKEIDLQSLEEELSADKLQCKLMYMGNDKNLLYINTESYLDGLYQGVVLEAKDSEITVLNNDAGLDIGNSVITDPYHMMSQGYSSLLGSVWDFYTATSWKMDENGQLTKDTGAKEYLPSDFCIRTTKEISADKICLEDGSVIETQVELSSNTILVPYQTDNETYVDFMDQDENVYRIKFEITYDDDFGYIGTIAGNRVSDYMTVVKNS